MIRLKNLIFVICFTFFSFSSFSFEKSSGFSLNEFDKLNTEGKTIVINSWNEWCSVCATQSSIFKQAKKDFPEFEFLFYDRTHQLGRDTRALSGNAAIEQARDGHLKKRFY